MNTSLPEQIAADGHAFVEGADLLTRIGASQAQFHSFAQEWDQLALDTYMADGGKYRYRRYGQFRYYPRTQELAQQPDTPYHQPSYVNSLNGDIDRVFEPLTPTFASSPVLRSALVFLGQTYNAVEPGNDWHIRLHPYRIIAEAGAAGQPAPEGRHRDGVHFIHSLLIHRENISGGVSTTYSLSGNKLSETQLTNPGDLLLGDDQRTLHDVSPIRPADLALPAWRDVLVIAFTKVLDGQELPA